MQLGVCAANVGIGYHAQHTKQCYADLRETIEQVRKVADFHWLYADTIFPHSERVEYADLDDWRDDEDRLWNGDYREQCEREWECDYDRMLHQRGSSSRLY